VLVVSRKENESIRIEPLEGVDPNLTLRELFAQGPIVLKLTHVGPRRVRIVIEAPRALKIMRGEVETACAEPPQGEPATTPRRNGTEASQ
jgi:sRNA-binding carbon storage regulator CsrA